MTWPSASQNSAPHDGRNNASLLLINAVELRLHGICSLVTHVFYNIWETLESHQAAFYQLLRTAVKTRSRQQLYIYGGTYVAQVLSDSCGASHFFVYHTSPERQLDQRLMTERTAEISDIRRLHRNDF